MMQPIHEAHATSLKDDLLRPEAFAAVAPTQRVSLVETHISWVFLLDRDVFKVKKPVDLGFLNFGSREQRLAACEEEVRLNARLAPGVYRGLVPITRGLDGRCVVGGSGRVIDWAVHMERLSDEERADTLLARGTLSGERIDAIATRIAEFHDTARGDEKVSRFARPSAIEKNVQENFVQTRHALSQYLDRTEAEEIVRWQTAFVHDERERFERRIAQGRIRDGHGDLRLEHVYVGPRGANPRPRLHRVQRALSLRRRLLRTSRFSRWTSRPTDGWTSPSVSSPRTRARPTTTTSTRSSTSTRATAPSCAGRSRRCSRTTRAPIRRHAIAPPWKRDGTFFSLSRPIVRALLRPAVVAIGGVIASGKSAIANRLSAELSAPVIETDRTRKSVLGVNALRPLHEPAWSGPYSPAFSDRVYDELFRRAGVVLASGRPVVLDASFRSASLRSMARDLAKAHGVPFRFIECRATPEVCRERLAERARQRTVSDGRLAIFDEFCARYEPVVELGADEHLVLDTTKPIEDSLETLRQSLETWPQGLVG